MNKNPILLSLTVGSALVLSACGPSDEDNTTGEPTPEATEQADNSEEITEETSEESFDVLADWFVIPSGDYTVTYSYTDSLQNMVGWYGGGTMLLGEDGSCAFELAVINLARLGPDTSAGQAVIPELTAVKTPGANDAMVYANADLDYDTFQVPSAQSFISLENPVWDGEFDDQYFSIAARSVGNFQGPCFMAAIADMLIEHPNAENLTPSGQTGGYIFDPERLGAYEQERLAETAAAMFATQENAEELAAAWIADLPRYAPELSDPAKYIVSQQEGSTANDTVLSITGLAPSLGFATWSFEILEPYEEGIPNEVYAPDVTGELFTVADYGLSLAPSLRGSQ